MKQAKGYFRNGLHNKLSSVLSLSFYFSTQMSATFLVHPDANVGWGFASHLSFGFSVEEDFISLSLSLDR